MQKRADLSMVISIQLIEPLDLESIPLLLAPS